MAGYKESQRFADQYFHREGTLSATAVTSDNALRVGDHLGSLALKIAANGAVSIAAAATLTVEFLESDTLSGTFAAQATNPKITITGPTGGVSYADKEDILTLVLPDCKKYVKVKVTGTASTSGKVDMYLDYLAR